MGEQVLVCGEAPFLGGGDPERALPLFTTPADYPLWFTRENLPSPAGCSKTGHDYRYCVYRGGRFHRWDSVELPRVIRPSKTPHIARDILDEEPRQQQQQQRHPSEDNNNSGSTNAQRTPQTTVYPPPPAGDVDAPHPPEPQRHRGEVHTTVDMTANTANGSASAHGGPGQAEADERGSVRTSPSTGPRPPAEGKDPDLFPPVAAAASAAAVPAAPFGGAGGREGQLETPSFSAAKTAATAAAFLHYQGLGQLEHCVELPAADGADDSEEEGGDRVVSLQFGARELSRRQRHQQQRAEGGGDGDSDDEGGGGGVMRLRRPPSLEAEDGEGAGLGLGLRLGMEAMSSPPPRAASAGVGIGVGEKGKAHSPLWSPRDGGVVVASFYLPVTLTKHTVPSASSGDDHDPEDRDNDCDGWTAEWDHEQLTALQTNLRVVRVGTIKCDHDITEEDKAAVVKALLKLNCVPVFLSKSLTHHCYYTYCKGVLWPVMHGMLEMFDDLPNTNTLLDDKAITSGWQAYKQVNRAFRDKVVEVFHEGDMIWVHGFHLAILPAFLDRTVKVARIGLFLHTPFPPSEVFRALPHREDLLRGMLGADQVGFHRFSDSRHFLSSCRRLLGLTHVHSQETGLVQILHGGKPTILTDRHAGVDPEAVRNSLQHEDSRREVARLKGLHGDRVVVAGVESVEKVKGVWLKMLAFEDMLRRYPHLVGRVSMHEVGIANPARGQDYRACRESLSELAVRMNAKHGEGTLVYEEREAKDAALAQRAALMMVSSVFVKTPVHNGLSTMPIEYRVVQEHLCQQQAEDQVQPTLAAARVPGVLILSEAASCSPALRGSFSVNPWQVQAVADAMANAVTADVDDRTVWHEEDAEWCESNTTAKWAEDVLGVLTTVVKENRSRYATTGLGLTSRVVGTDPTFKRLDTNCARKAYGLSKSRVFFLDYGGTLVKDTPAAPHGGVGVGIGANGKVDYDRCTSIGRKNKTLRLRPGKAVLEGLTELCRDPNNVVFVVSGRGKDELQQAFGHIQGLGLAAEHGSFFRWPTSAAAAAAAASGDGATKSGDVDGDGWEALHPHLMDTAWKDVARRFMQDFQIHTHGSYIEEKGTAMLWHYGDAEPEFGAMQAKQLQDELTDVLRSSSAANTTTTTHAEADAIGLSPILPGGTSSKVNVDFNAGKMVDAAVKKTSLATILPKSMSTTAVTGSTRSNSVASEGLGSIEITHEEGLNSEAGGGGAYLEVRARGANKGNFVHMVLGRLAWPVEGSAGDGDDDGGGDDCDDCDGAAAAAPGGRFCLCVGDDVSDEDMFVAAKSYEGAAWSKDHCSVSNSAALALAEPHRIADPSHPYATSTATFSSSSASGKENLCPAAHAQRKKQQQQRQQRSYILTVTVGSKPSDADAWLPGVDAVVSLLRALRRVTSRHGTTQRSKLAPHAAAVAMSNVPLLPDGGAAAGLQGLQGLEGLQLRDMQTGSLSPPPPTRAFRSASASRADSSSTPAAIAKSKDLSSTAMISGGVGGGSFGVAEGEDDGVSGLGPIPDVSMASASTARAVMAMNVGQGVPVVRRHSYSTGLGVKPRISLSLGEFLRAVAQPEPEPPMF
eukprot:g17344.t1